jgi:hypothetical protein
MYFNAYSFRSTGHDRNSQNGHFFVDRQGRMHQHAPIPDHAGLDAPAQEWLHAQI